MLGMTYAVLSLRLGVLHHSPLCEGALDIVGVLLERRPGHIVLSNGTKVLLKSGVSASHIPIGRSVTISCTVKDGAKLAEALRLNPDWLLEAAEAAGFGGQADEHPEHDELLDGEVEEFERRELERELERLSVI